MDIKNILYYSRGEGMNTTLSLRSLHLKEEYENKLETLFYAAKDATDSQDLLEKLNQIYYEQIELCYETPLFVSFKVIDACGNKNYLKFKLRDNTSETENISETGEE